MAEQHCVSTEQGQPLTFWDLLMLQILCELAPYSKLPQLLNMSMQGVCMLYGLLCRARTYCTCMNLQFCKLAYA